MKQIIIITISLLLCGISLHAQDFTLEQSLYKGSIDGKQDVMLFLSVENPCGGLPYAVGMYKHEKQGEWIELTISFNQEESQYCMVEYLFTGVMILKKTSATLEGVWISPDTKTQLPVKLYKKTLSDSEKADFLEIMEKLFYSNNDC